MENRGILVGQLLNIQGKQNGDNPNKMDVTCDFMDVHGNKISNIRLYGYTGTEVYSRGTGYAALNYTLSLRTSTTNQSPTGESVFALYVRNVGYIHPNDVQTMPSLNSFELNGTLTEDPIETIENGAKVIDIKMNVMRRKTNKEPDPKNGTAYETMSFRFRKPEHVEVMSGCGKGSTITINGVIKPIPDSYIVATEIVGLQVFFQKPRVVTDQGFTQNGMNQGFNQGFNQGLTQNGMNQGLIQGCNQPLHNSGVLRYNPQDGSIIGDLDKRPYNFNEELVPKGATAVNQYTYCVINQDNRLINSEGQLINEHSQLIDQNGQVLQNNYNPNGATGGFTAGAGVNPNGATGGFTAGAGVNPNGVTGGYPTGAGVNPNGATGGFTAGAGVNPNGATGGYPTGAGVNPNGVTGGYPTGAGVNPNGATGGFTTGAGVNPNGATGGFTAGAGVNPNGATGGFTAGAGVNPNGATGGYPTGTGVTPNASTGGFTTQAGANQYGNIGGYPAGTGVNPQGGYGTQM